MDNMDPNTFDEICKLDSNGQPNEDDDTSTVISESTIANTSTSPSSVMQIKAQPE